MIDIWQVGNTGVRNPMRIQEAFRLYAESNLVGKIRGVEGSVALTNYFCERGVLNNAPGKDPTGSYGRKWRLVFNKNGLTYDVVKASGVRQSDLGPIDCITPFGRSFLDAKTIPAVQECFLRASAMPMEDMSGGTTFSPLRWTLAVMLEIERKTGSSAVGFTEFAAYIQTTNPTEATCQVVEKILSIRAKRDKATSKRKFDKELFAQLSVDYPKKVENFLEYGDMNLRYLRATGIVRAQGKGIVIVGEKHDLAEMLAKDQQSNVPILDRLKELYNGPRLPTDDMEMAKRVLSGLECRLQERGITFALDHSQLHSAADVNTARHNLEVLLDNDAEVMYARTQKSKWGEIADYMALVMKRGGSKRYDDDTEIKVPKDEVAAYLEWTIWRAFLAMNTLSNKPYEMRRFKVDQDFFPVNTAPGNGPDLVAEYGDCKVVIEVTMSDSSRQEAMEGEPVRRHVYDIAAGCEKPVYGLFIANHVDTNTAETFRVGTWYGKGDIRTRLNIVPLSLSQFREYFVAAFKSGMHRNGEIVELLEDCVAKRDDGDAPEWINSIAGGVSASARVRSDGVEILCDVAVALRFREYLPLYSLRAACGVLRDGEIVEPVGWVKAEGIGKLDNTMVVVRAEGDSMEPTIHDGDLCVVRKVGGGNYADQIVLAQRNDKSSDPESGGAYLLKKLVKKGDKTLLRSINHEYSDIAVERNNDIAVVAYLHKVLNG